MKLNKTYRNFIILLIVLCAMTISIIPVIADETQDDSPLNRKIVPGKMYPDIGTFNGWSFWVGFDYAFSETYVPEDESYAWIVHFAPEGMYVSLQGAKSVYSGVDVNAGMDFFYGIAYSPDGDRITTKYFGDLSGMTFSTDHFSTKALPTGPASNLSIGISSATTFYKLGKEGPIQTVIQYGAGFSIAYALISIPIPFSVSLETESWVKAGFYPIAGWDIWSPGKDPVDAILYGLDCVRSSKGTAFDDINLAGFADPMHRMIDTFPLNAEIKEFIHSKSGNSAIEQLIKEVDQWKQTGDTKNLPEKLKPQIPPPDIHKIMKPIQAATTCAFEVGYFYGDKSDNIYANCMEEIACKPGEYCTITVTTDEIAEWVPESSPSDFEGVTIVFDVAPEDYLVSKITEKKVPIKNGKAEYKFASNSTTPILLGVRIDRCAATGNRRVELCRRKITYSE